MPDYDRHKTDYDDEEPLYCARCGEKIEGGAKYYIFRDVWCEDCVENHAHWN